MPQPFQHRGLDFCDLWLEMDIPLKANRRNIKVSEGKELGEGVRNRLSTIAFPKPREGKWVT